MTHFWLGIGAAVGIFAGMILHEYAHARAAVAAGDRTPKLYGRVTLNPKAHIDPLGTIIMPAIFIVPMLVGKPLGFIFGYAKPVPLNTRAMRHARWSPFFVAMAGPLTNFALALLAGVGLKIVGVSALLEGNAVSLMLLGALTVNSFLALINALPVPPLDGSRILGLFLSPAAAYKIEELGQYAILFLIALFLIFGRVVAAMADPVCRITSLNLITGCPLN